MSLIERIQHNLNRKNNPDYIADVQGLVDWYNCNLEDGYPLEALNRLAMQFEDDISERFGYGVSFVAEDAVKMGMRLTRSEE